MGLQKNPGKSTYYMDFKESINIMTTEKPTPEEIKAAEQLKQDIEEELQDRLEQDRMAGECS